MPIVFRLPGARPGLPFLPCSAIRLVPPMTALDMPVLSSTFFLTLLMLIGLFFFIRASTKERIEVARLVALQPQEPVLEKLEAYFTQRAYRLAAVDAAENLVTFEGFVRPSVFLAIFLSSLAAVGLLCLSLVLSLLFPNVGQIFLGLVGLAPVAGWFYWQRAGRLERVSLQVSALDGQPQTQTAVVVTGHRDELAELQQALGLKPLETALSDRPLQG
ncbi:MAG: cofactor assembly of complex C subunit B [Synechococcales bacterium]|nr:cofactor assembly of complex C subunit B [Synechococcales bacterium]